MEPETSIDNIADRVWPLAYKGGSRTPSPLANININNASGNINVVERVVLRAGLNDAHNIHDVALCAAEATIMPHDPAGPFRQYVRDCLVQEAKLLFIVRRAVEHAKRAEHNDAAGIPAVLVTAERTDAELGIRRASCLVEADPSQNNDLTLRDFMQEIARTGERLISELRAG